MIHLTPRLSAVAALVRQGSALADVGCDHGYLPVFLACRQVIIKAIACDIHRGPLASCDRLIREYGLQDIVTARLSDGLDCVSSDECDDIVLAGMGGELMAAIISRCPYAGQKHLIFQPMTHPEIVRRFLYQNGYEISSDKIVKECNRYYSVFDAYYTGVLQTHNEADYYLGNIKDFSQNGYFHHLLHYLENKQKGGGDYSDVIAAVKEKL